MKAYSVRVVLGLVLIILGVSYAVIRAQGNRPDILLQTHGSRNGSELENPNMAVFDEVPASCQFSDGTELEITARAIKR